ncbi:MAG TPA: diaminopimelate epimerase [Rhodothermales bacterium]|nr:diaminopimelate epimerase [Rhodothermales bacterium]
MSRGLVLEFTKMHGAGNDFIVIDNRFFYLNLKELADIAAKYCPRQFGIGADGVLALDEPLSEGDHFHMTYFNADGSPGEMCGNGARCLARFAFEAGFSEQPLRFSTTSGNLEGYVDPSDPRRVRIVLPPPSAIKSEFTKLFVDGRTLAFSYVQAGVPHAVNFGGNVDDNPVDEWGAFVRHHAAFLPTNGANVDFVEVTRRGPEPRLRVRCYERGVEAETLACGTGAVASFAAAVELGLIEDEESVIEMRGGELRVGYTTDRASVFLEGPAVVVYRGTVVL